MPIAMAASTVFSFLCRRFLTAIMHGFERRFLFPAHGCFCGGCCPRCPRACSGLGRAALCFSRWFLDLSASPPFFGCGVRFSLVGFFWFLGAFCRHWGDHSGAVVACAQSPRGLWWCAARGRGVACGVCGTPYIVARHSGPLLYCNTTHRTTRRKHVWYCHHPPLKSVATVHYQGSRLLTSPRIC